MTDGMMLRLSRLEITFIGSSSKSSETGTANALTITETGVDLGLTTDSDLDGIPDNKMLSAQILLQTLTGWNIIHPQIQ